MNETEEVANGEAAKIIADAKAIESTIKDVITLQATSYEEMNKAFGVKDETFIL